MSTLCKTYSCGNLIYHLVYQEIGSLAIVLKNCFEVRELHMNSPFHHLDVQRTLVPKQSIFYWIYMWSDFGYKTNDVKLITTFCTRAILVNRLNFVLLWKSWHRTKHFFMKFAACVRVFTFILQSTHGENCKHVYDVQLAELK